MLFMGIHIGKYLFRGHMKASLFPTLPPMLSLCSTASPNPNLALEFDHTSVAGVLSPLSSCWEPGSYESVGVFKQAFGIPFLCNA